MAKPAVRSVDRPVAAVRADEDRHRLLRVGGGRICPSAGTENTRYGHERPPSWNVERPYGKEDVDRLRGSVPVEHTLARLGAERLRELISGDGYVRALGASTGNQAVQQVQAGLEAAHGERLAGGRRRQLRGDDVSRPETLPVEQRARRRPADQPGAPPRRPDPHLRGRRLHALVVPLVADAESGFGGALNCFELTKGRSRPAPRACTSRTSSPPRRSAATWAARSSPPQGRSQPDRGPPGRRRGERADRDRRLAPTRSTPTCWRPTSTRPTASSPPASAPRRASSGSTRAWTRRSPARSRTRPMPICSGARPRSPTSTRPSASPRPSTSASGKLARLQLLALLQLEANPERRGDP